MGAKDSDRIARIASVVIVTSRTVKFEKCVSILSGFAFQSEFFNTEGDGIPLIRIRDVTRGVSKTFYSSDFDSNFLIQNGDTLIGMDGEFNIAQWSGGESLLNQRVCKISVKNPNEVDERYLVRFLEIELKKIEERTPFVTVKHLSGKTLNEIEIPLPSLEDQRRIASILDAADALRSKRRESLRKLEVLLKSVFLEMFGDPVTNPKGWVVEQLGEVGNLDRGISKHRPRNDPRLLNGIYPLIQTGDISRAGNYIYTHTQTYSEFGLNQSRLWPNGVLCITIAANIAKTAITTFPCCFPDSVVGFISNDRSTVEYVQNWMSFLQSNIEEMAPESAQKNINLKILNELKLPIPPIELQKDFSRFAKTHETMKLQFQKKSEMLETLFSALQHQAFNGTLTSETLGQKVRELEQQAVPF